MPAFSGRRFGEWSRILVGQINRGHYRFVVDSDRRIVGFVGWAETSEDVAERWLRATGRLPDIEAAEGDCMVLNAWASRSPEATRFLFRALRRIGSGKKAVFFKRFYGDGRVRPFRMEANRGTRQENGERRTDDLPPV
ncbi:hypothetical protein ACUN0C_12305 [Faunimonas sp. B44]|uniref:hypothetical protein n=1 Tax=Faunimonas sp. B44 TaxID=3461493 RepID=UPI004044CEC2